MIGVERFVTVGSHLTHDDKVVVRLNMTVPQSAAMGLAQEEALAECVANCVSLLNAHLLHNGDVDMTLGIALPGSVRADFKLVRIGDVPFGELTRLGEAFRTYAPRVLRFRACSDNTDQPGITCYSTDRLSFEKAGRGGRFSVSIDLPAGADRDRFDIFALGVKNQVAGAIAGGSYVSLHYNELTEDDDRYSLRLRGEAVGSLSGAATDLLNDFFGEVRIHTPLTPV